MVRSEQAKSIGTDKFGINEITNHCMIVTGDPSQIDLPPNTKSGLVEALQVLDGVEGIVTVRFVPSLLWSRRGLSVMNESLWGGFVVEGVKRSTVVNVAIAIAKIPEPVPTSSAVNFTAGNNAATHRSYLRSPCCWSSSSPTIW